MQKTLLIDNFDSFTFNLYQYLGELKASPIVFRNNEITIKNIIELEPTHIIISPGPGTVENNNDFGVCRELLTTICTTGLHGKCVPLLGICLGHQGIIRYFDGKIEHAPSISHGRRSNIKITAPSILYKDVPDGFEAMRYHSLIGTNPSSELTITSVLEGNEKVIMSVEHKTLPIYGIQYHPESIGTSYGKKILENFLRYSEATILNVNKKRRKFN